MDERKKRASEDHKPPKSVTKGAYSPELDRFRANRGKCWIDGRDVKGRCDGLQATCEAGSEIDADLGVARRWRQGFWRLRQCVRASLQCAPSDCYLGDTRVILPLYRRITQGIVHFPEVMHGCCWCDTVVIPACYFS